MSRYDELAFYRTLVEEMPALIDRLYKRLAEK